MNTESLHYEAETLMLNRFFTFNFDVESQRWLVQLRWEMVQGYKRILFPPGQDVRNYPPTGRWAERPWFFSYEAATRMRGGSVGRKPRCISVQALHVLPDGRFDLYNGSTVPERLTSPYAVVGADNKYAIAILWNGGDAIRACEAAIALGKYCTGPVTSLRLIERARAAD